MRFSIATLRFGLLAVATVLGGCAGSHSSLTPPGPVGLSALRAPARSNAVGAITEYAVPTANAGPAQILAAQDGALWFTESTASKVGRISTDGQFVEYSTPTANASPAGMTLTSDPNFPIWFTENAVGGLALMDLSGDIFEFAISKPAGARPYGITAGPAGNQAVWYTNFQAGNSIGRVNARGQFGNFKLPTAGGGPAFIVPGPDGALWFTEFNSGKIGRITLRGHITEYAIAPTAKPNGIVAGPDGALWFADSGTNNIGRIDKHGAITKHPIKTAHSVPLGIAVGPDSALWFTESKGNKIGRLDPASGKMTEYKIPTAATCATGIAAGPDNAMWFTESCTNKIGRISTT